MSIIDFFLLKNRGSAAAQLAVAESETVENLETDLAETKRALRLEEAEADKYATQASQAHAAIAYLIEKIGDGGSVADATADVQEAIALAMKKTAVKPAISMAISPVKS